MRRMAIATAALAALALALPVDAASEDHENKRGDVNVVASGGFGDYTGGLSEHTQTGPTWGVLVNLQPWHVLGYELAYDGSRNLVDDVRLNESPALTRHGMSGMLKFGLPFIETIRPFAGIGIGASMVNVSNDGGLYKDDFVEEVPMAAGIEFNTGAVTAGFRTTYRWLIDESFADAASAGNPQGGFLNAELNLGARF